MSDTGKAYEAAVISELLQSSGWRVLKGRLTHKLETVRMAILKGRWDTPERIRDLAFLQGQEAFLHGLTGENAPKLIEWLAQAEPQPAAVEERPAVGRKPLGRARPVGE